MRGLILSIKLFLCCSCGVSAGPAVVTVAEGNALKLADGVQLFNNRDYVAQDVPAAMKGLTFIQGPLSAGRITCQTDGDVFALTSVPGDKDSRAAELNRLGFERMSIPPFHLFKRPDPVEPRKGRIPVSLTDWNTECAVWRKGLVKGERIELSSETQYPQRPTSGPWCIFLAQLAGDGTRHRSPFDPPLAQNYTIAAEVPDAHRGFVHDPCLCVLPSGTLIAGSPIWGRANRGFSPDKLSGGPKFLQLTRSRDGGRTWQRLPDLMYAECTLFALKGALYMFTQKQQHRDVYIMRSRNEGETWEGPVKVLEGRFWNCQTSFVIRDNTLYWAMDESFRGILAVAADLNKDLLSPDTWRRSEVVYTPGVPRNLSPRLQPEKHDGLLEPNVMQIGDELIAACRVNPHGLGHKFASNVTALFKIRDEDGRLSIEFENYYPWPGAYTKFCVVYDERTRLFWLAANQSMGYDRARFGIGDAATSRRALMLHFSNDGLSWLPGGCIALAPTSTQSFMYPSMKIDGDDLVILSRTGKHSDHHHDADLSTFHRVRNFRDLAWH